jgi:hypothetical protein
MRQKLIYILYYYILSNLLDIQIKANFNVNLKVYKFI